MIYWFWCAFTVTCSENNSQSKLLCGNGPIFVDLEQQNCGSSALTSRNPILDRDRVPDKPLNLLHTLLCLEKSVLSKRPSATQEALRLWTAQVFTAQDAPRQSPVQRTFLVVDVLVVALVLARRFGDARGSPRWRRRRRLRVGRLRRAAREDRDGGRELLPHEEVDQQDRDRQLRAEKPRS